MDCIYRDKLVAYNCIWLGCDVLGTVYMWMERWSSFLSDSRVDGDMYSS
jgi:hypothetical protein